MHLSPRNVYNHFYSRHVQFWTRDNFYLFWSGMVFFLIALFVQHFSYKYIDNYINGKPVDDILLDNIPTFNLDFFVVQVPLLLTLLILILLLAKPQYLPFSMKALALFIIVRSFFISLTHLGADLHQITFDEDRLGFAIYDFLYNSKNDFFFSGHVGTSVLYTLVFWQEKFWRYFFMATSLVMGVSVILAHMHYSIDVFAAPFITYGIFVMAQKFFTADYKLVKT